MSLPGEQEQLAWAQEAADGEADESPELHPVGAEHPRSAISDFQNRLQLWRRRVRATARTPEARVVQWVRRQQPVVDCVVEHGAGHLEVAVHGGLRPSTGFELIDVSRSPVAELLDERLDGVLMACDGRRDPTLLLSVNPEPVVLDELAHRHVPKVRGNVFGGQLQLASFLDSGASGQPVVMADLRVERVMLRAPGAHVAIDAGDVRGHLLLHVRALLDLRFALALCAHRASPYRAPGRRPGVRRRCARRWTHGSTSLMRNRRREPMRSHGMPSRTIISTQRTE